MPPRTVLHILMPLAHLKVMQLFGQQVEVEYSMFSMGSVRGTIEGKEMPAEGHLYEIWGVGGMSALVYLCNMVVNISWGPSGFRENCKNKFLCK